MGRPLNKKYFGNRNIGSTSTTADDGIGGEGIASIGSITAGSFTGAQADAATFTFPTPAIPTGVTATGTPNFTTLTATISGSQTRAYPVTAGALSVGSGSSASTYTATLRTQALATVVYASASTISFTSTTTAYISGTNITISGASITGNMTIGGTAIAANQTYYLGAPTTATSATLYANYNDAVNATSPLTISNGTTTGATFTVGATYSNVTAVTVVTGGTIASGAVTAYAAATTPAVQGGYGAGLQITPATFGLTSATITLGGSGYTPTQTLTVTIGSNQGAAATSVLTTDSGNVGSSTNQENAILMTARLPGGSATTVDIIRQVSTSRYKVTDGTRTGIVKLKSSVATAAGEGSIRLVDSTGGTYFATKITAHKATITRGTGTNAAFVTGTAVKWNMTAATADSLLIDNA